MDIQEERRWIEECLAGNPEGYRPLVEANQGKVVGVVMKLTGRAEVADDIAQEAFVRAYTKLHTFRQESRFVTWVTKIALRLCHDLHRVEKRWAPLPADDSHASGQARADELMVLAERDQAVTQAMQSLPPRYREVMVLRYCEGCSLEEISQLLGKGLSAVKMTVHRGVEMLRRELERRGVL